MGVPKKEVRVKGVWFFCVICICYTLDCRSCSARPGTARRALTTFASSPPDCSKISWRCLVYFFLLLRLLGDYVYSFSSFSPPAMVLSPLKLADEARKAAMRRASLFGKGLKLAGIDVDFPQNSIFSHFAEPADAPAADLCSLSMSSTSSLLSLLSCPRADSNSERRTVKFLLQIKIFFFFT